MKTPVYVKMDTHEPLLLSEGVCRQMGIITYHPEVKPRKVEHVGSAKREAEPNSQHEGKVSDSGKCQVPGQVGTEHQVSPTPDGYGLGSP